MRPRGRARPVPEVLVVCPGAPTFALEMAASLHAPPTYAADFAADLAETLAIVRADRPAAVVVCIPFPPEGGLTAIEALRAAAPTLPILGLYGRPLRRAEVLAAGATAAKCLPCDGWSILNHLLDFLPRRPLLHVVPRRS